MTDKFSKRTRSGIMSKIRSKNTSPELLLRGHLWSLGLKGYRIHCNLPGKPDVVFINKRVAIFADGDFWHGYSWKKLGKVPPKKYWQKKIRGNIHRDKKNTKILKKEGWTVLRFWEHQIRKDPLKIINKIKKIIHKKES